MRAGVLFLICLACAAPVFAQSEDAEPLSAIDWLSRSVEQPDVSFAPPTPGTQSSRTPDPNEAPVTDSAAAPSVSVETLGGPAPRAIGVLDPAVTGLPVDLWQRSEADTLSALLAAEETDTLPAVQSLLSQLILTQANPPRGANGTEQFLLARVDKLLSMGALESAQSLLEVASPESPALFRRWFDVTLLTGTENRACRELSGRPDIAPTPSARIFCLARSGDWSAAALTLNTGRALGDIDPDTADLLARFLDPELFEGEPPLPTPSPVTPLSFRMFEAIGAPLSSGGLPRAFLHSDLRPNVGWKAQLEAAERLARAGAVSDNALVGLYTARVPAASGGVWERARAVGLLEAALEQGDADSIVRAVDALWEEARPVGVTAPLARAYGPRIIAALDTPQDATLFEFLLLSDLYEDAALTPSLARSDPFLARVARGMPMEDDATTPARPDARLVATAFTAAPDATLLAMAEEGRMGEAILRTLAVLQQGIDGDDAAFRDGIATLRALGLEDTARRVALQYLVLT